MTADDLHYKHEDGGMATSLVVACLCSVTAALMLFVSLFTTKWMVYTSKVEPLEFGLYRMCYVNQGICGGSDHIGIWIDFGGGWILYAMRFVIAGVVCCSVIALVTLGLLLLVEHKNRLIWWSSLLALGSGILWVVLVGHLLFFMFYWKEALSLDKRYLHLGWSFTMALSGDIFLSLSLLFQCIHIKGVLRTSLCSQTAVDVHLRRFVHGVANRFKRYACRFERLQVSTEQK